MNLVLRWGRALQVLKRWANLHAGRHGAVHEQHSVMCVVVHNGQSCSKA